MTKYVVWGTKREGTNVRYWVLSESSDDVNWDDIDEQRQNVQLKGDYGTAEFVCRTSPVFRYIRLMQTYLNDKFD